MQDKEHDLTRVGRYVERARKTHYGTVSAAHQAARVNRETWQRAERGDKIRPEKERAIEKALGWDPGDFERIALGGEPFGSGEPLGGLAGASTDDLLGELRRRLGRAYESDDLDDDTSDRALSERGMPRRSPKKPRPPSPTTPATKRRKPAS